MSDFDLTEAVEAAAKAAYLAMIAHWGLDEDHWHRWDDDSDTFMVTSARPHWRAQMAPGVAAAAPLIEAQVREQVVAETTDLVRALQAMCDDEWLRRRDRIMRLTGTRYLRDNGAGEIEYAAHMVRRLIEGLPGYDAIATSGAYLAWMRNGRDEGADAKDATS